MRLAYLYIVNYGIIKGFELIQQSIQNFILYSNQTNGRTFNRTMTLFCCIIIANDIYFFKYNYPNGYYLIDQTLLQKRSKFKIFLMSIFEYGRYDYYRYGIWYTGLYKEFYSNSVMFSMQAREEFVLPDKKPFLNLGWIFKCRLVSINKETNMIEYETIQEELNFIEKLLNNNSLSRNHCIIKHD